MSKAQRAAGVQKTHKRRPHVPHVNGQTIITPAKNSSTSPFVSPLTPKSQTISIFGRNMLPTDGFDRLPDSLLLLIFNRISDVKTLIRCRAVSTRFNSLVPQSDTLLLKVDRVISAADQDADGESFFLGFLRSVLGSIQHFISPKALPDPTRNQNSPTQILRGFERVRELSIELPSGDLRLEKGALIRWTAEFGKALKSCVIFGFRAMGDGGGWRAEVDSGSGGGGGLKMRVVWTISALIAASARHYMLREVLRDHGELRRLVVRDRDGEGTVVMGEEGLKEFRESSGESEEDPDHITGDINCVWWRNNRTTVPAVRMRMRHEARLELSGGVRMEGATLVVVRPTSGIPEAESEGMGVAGLDCRAFGGVYAEAIEKLLKSRSYLLEMNSF